MVTSLNLEYGFGAKSKDLKLGPRDMENYLYD